MARGKQGTKGSSRNQLRIIAGQWRGRKLDFPDVEGLRPTPDRVRETLFNWLQSLLPGARCLDLFSGSGALGLEALSRGAAEAVMVDQNPQVIKQLNDHVNTLAAEKASVIQADVQAYLTGQSHPFDIVFLDPPYRKNLLEPCCTLLVENGWLSSSARIYMEVESEQEILPFLPPGWEVIREKQAGQVAYYLIQA